MKFRDFFTKKSDQVSEKEPVQAQTNTENQKTDGLLGVTAGADYMEMAFNELQNPDAVLRGKNKGVDEYYKLLYDGHVFSCVQSRKSGTECLEWDIDRGLEPTRESKFIKALFSKLNLYKVIDEMLDAVLYGYKPMEIYWHEVGTLDVENEVWKGNFLIPSAIVGKPPHWFKFDSDENLVYDRRGVRDVPHSRKFIVVKHNDTGGNPYGRGVLSNCFWPWVYKKAVMEFWTRYCEKYGSPYLLGILDKTAPSYSPEDLASALSGLIGGGVGVFSLDSLAGEKIEAISAGSTQSGETYKQVVGFMNAEISKAVLSQTLSTEQGDKGTFALGKVHMDVRQELVESDMRLIEQTFNTLIQWLVEYNFESVERMPYFGMYEEDDVNLALAERDSKLLSTGKIVFTKEHYKKYGLKDDEFYIPEEPENKQETPAFNEHDEQAKEFGSIGEEMLKVVSEAIEGAKSYEEIEDKVFGLYPDLNSDKLMKALEHLLFVSEGFGRVEGAKDAK
ncbi:MAG: DUF935 domain-containing protein [Candidatus Kapabacteria bacterium]|nr:DUF935 domain-containing protein [Candidatus Kapabacteria bacterium]